MSSQNDSFKDPVRLRRCAEEMVRARSAASPGDCEALSAEEAARALHDLNVHQIELEMQNEELRRAQMELDAARERYFDLYDLAPVGYCTVSELGLILEANLTAAKLLGVARTTLVKQPLSRYVFQDDQDIHYRHFKQLLETGLPRAWELRMLRIDAAPFWARVEATAAKSADGACFYVTVSDVNELRLQEQEKAALEAQNRQLEFTHRQEEHLAQQRLESVGTLANGIAHDINNLLGVVLAQADLALAELSSGNSPEAELNRIRAVAIRGSEIGRQLMIYAGEESEALLLVDVSQTIEDMIELLKVSVSKHAVLETDLGRDLPVTAATPAQLRRVVMNLVTNASDAIGRMDGVIQITTSHVTVGKEIAWIASERLAEGDYVQLAVSDTGCGMAPETKARAFDANFTTKSEGHGLGLAVVREIVRSLRGAVRLESTLGKGTRFEIFLPCANHPGQLTSVIPPVGKEAPEFRAGTILIVEDEESLRQPLSKMIRKAGYSVLEAGDGDAALDQIRARQNRIDVLVLDITLPGASSREVFEEARRIRPDMKVIVTSAYTAAAAATSLGAEVESFLRKPFRVNDVIALIKAV